MRIQIRRMTSSLLVACQAPAGREELPSSNAAGNHESPGHLHLDALPQRAGRDLFEAQAGKNDDKRGVNEQTLYPDPDCG